MNFVAFEELVESSRGCYYKVAKALPCEDLVGFSSDIVLIKGEALIFHVQNVIKNTYFSKRKAEHAVE